MTDTTIADTTQEVTDATQEAVKQVNQLTQYVQDSIPGLITFGLKVLAALVAFFIGRLVIRWIRKIVRRSFERSGADKGVEQFVDSLLKYGLYALLVFSLISSLGFDTTSVAAVLASGGVAIGLALQGSLSNFAGGVLILLLKPFVVGDYIIEDTNGKEGTVKEIQIFYTKLSTIDNKTIVIPNGMLTNNSITNATAKELEQFKSVCNQLLSRTYIVRTIYQPGKGRVDNPDYLFLSRHYEAVQEYLSLLDWDLRRDELNGYFYVLNTDEANRCNLNKKETAILLALRLIYEENMERLGLEQDAVCTVRDVLEKVVTDYPVFPAKPNMEEVKRAFTVLENHSVIQRLEGKFNQGSCRIAILPTILSAVSSEKLNLVVSVLKKEETDEEAEENPADQLALFQ